MRDFLDQKSKVYISPENEIKDDLAVWKTAISKVTGEYLKIDAVY